MRRLPHTRGDGPDWRYAMVHDLCVFPTRVGMDRGPVVSGAPVRPSSLHA